MNWCYLVFSNRFRSRAAFVDLHAKAQRSRHICLPVGTVEHKHASETAEEHPVWIGAHLHCYTGSQHHKHCRHKHTQEVFQKDNTAELRHCVKGSKRRTGGEGVTAVVKQLPQWRTAVSAPGLLAVDGV